MKHIKHIEGINRIAFRWVFNLKKRDHIFDLMLSYEWDTLEERCKIADAKMYYRMLSGNAALDTDRFMLHFSKEYDTCHGATKGTRSTNVAKFSYRHRIHRYL